MTWRPEWFTPLSWEPEALKEVGQAGDQTVFLRDKEWAIQDVHGGRSDGGRGTFSLFKRRPEAKSELAGFILTQEAA